MSIDRIRIGVIGAGKIARDQHLPAIAGSPNFELVAVVSPEGNDCGVPGFSDVEGLLASGLVMDAVSICTPPLVRADIATRALTGGLHVMLEKPPAVSAKLVEELRQGAGRADKTLMTSWHSRETVAVDKASEWLVDKHITGGTVTWREDVRKWHPGQDWLLSGGGFGVFDPAINALSILTRILPGRLALKNADLAIPANRQAPMEAHLELSHDGEALLECDFSILQEGLEQWEIEIITEEGAVRLGDGGNTLSGREFGSVRHPNMEYPRLYERFSALIRSGECDVDVSPLSLVEDALRIGSIRSTPDFHFASPVRKSARAG